MTLLVTRVLFRANMFGDVYNMFSYLSIFSKSMDISTTHEVFTTYYLLYVDHATIFIQFRFISLTLAYCYTKVSD